MKEQACKPVIVGIDIGATKTKMAFLRQNKLITFFHKPTPQEPERAADMIVRALSRAKLPGSLEGIGIGCPGPLNQEKGVVLSPPNLPRWNRFRLKAVIEKRLGTRAILENDANAGALGEAVHGSGRRFRHVFYMTISTGIGTGLVLDKRIYRGSKGLAGEIWAFVPESFRGNEGTWNLTELGSGKGMVKQVKHYIAQGRKTLIRNTNISTGSIMAAWEKGDPLAREVVTTARRSLAGALSFVVHMMAPDLIVLGGGLCTDPRWLVDPVRRMVKKHIHIPELAEIPVRRARLWNEAVLYGAIALFDE